MLLYTDLVRSCVEDIVATVPAMRHVDPSRLAVVAARRWAGSGCGHLGKCYSLVGRSEPTFGVWVRGRSKKIIEVSEWYRHEPTEFIVDGRPALYMIELHLPRLFEADPLETIVHELFHISEAFDGSLRSMRHGKAFDWNVQRLMREWRKHGDAELYELASMDFAQLLERFGSIAARRLPAKWKSPRVVRIEAPYSYEEAVPIHYPGCRLARNYPVQAIKPTPAKYPPEIDEADCPLWNYHDSGSEQIAPALARYLKPAPFAKMPA